MNKFVSQFVQIRNLDVKVFENNDNSYMGYIIPKSSLVPAGKFMPGTAYFDDWASETLFQV